MVVKHVKWETSEGNRLIGGKVGIRLYDSNGWNEPPDSIEILQLSGKALPAEMLVPMLEKALGREFFEKAEEMHRSRVRPWRVEVHTGRSGAKDFQLRILKNSDMLHAPITASLHVSMCGKLNIPIDLWIGDLPPLLAELIEHYPPNPKRYHFDMYEPRRFSFCSPGEESGLLALLDDPPIPTNNLPIPMDIGGDTHDES